MQSSRREEEYVPVSPSEPGHGLNSVSRRDVADLPRERSLSPRSMLGGLRRDFDGNRGSGSVERRGYGLDVRSVSPLPYHRGVMERPHFNEEVVRARYEYVEDAEFDQQEFGRARSRSPPPSYRGVMKRPHFGEEFVRVNHEYGRDMEFEQYEFARSKEFQKGEYDGAVEFDPRTKARNMHNYDKNHGTCRYSKGMGPPPYRGGLERPRFSKEDVHGKHEFVGAVEFDPRSKARIMHDYDEDYGGYNEGMDYCDSRILGAHELDMPLQKPVHLEKRNVRGGSYKLHANSISKYREHNAPLSASNAKVGQFEHGSIQYQDSVRSDFGPVKEPHKGGGKPFLHPRNDSYNMVAPSYSKDFASSSSKTLQREHLDPYMGDPSVPPDSYIRDGGRVRETMGSLAFNQRPLKDNVRNYESFQKNSKTYSQWGAYSPARPDRSDNHHSIMYEEISDFHKIPPGDVHGMMPPTTRDDYDRRDLIREHMMHPTGEQFEKHDRNPGDTRTRNMLEHHIKNPFASDYPILRTSAASRHRAEHMSSGHPNVEFERRNPQDHRSMRTSMSHDHQISNLRSDMQMRRDAELEFQEDRYLKAPPVNTYGPEVHRITGRSHVIDDELGLYEPLDRMPKGKYSMEDVSRFNQNSMSLTKYNEPRDFENPYDDDEKWNYEDYNDEEMGDLYLHKPAQYGYTRNFREAEISHDRQGPHEHVASDGRISSHRSIGHSQRQPARYYKNEHLYTKPYPKLGSSNWRNSYHANRKNGNNKEKKSWKGKDNFYEDETYDGDFIEVWDDTAIPDPHEDSEEFKQLVHEAFLSYIKRLNADPYIRGRYTEQGNAGTLFCIVCRRSCSKEFMDTRRLAMHAFMSHKPGMRVAHLGLHKAICVLMGWDSDSPPDTVTWAPQMLSSADALSQKEDLILWPPLVIVHNISLLNNNPEEQKPITPEMLEVTIRGKGFVDGKVMVCLGKPADGSILVVKFLGTFTGLNNVERLHQYFADNKHGRIDLRRILSENGDISSSNWKGAESEEDKVEELILYGYMGTSEDLHKLEFNTKKNISVKSKKAIQDIANAPVRPKDR